MAPQGLLTSWVSISQAWAGQSCDCDSMESESSSLPPRSRLMQNTGKGAKFTCLNFIIIKSQCQSHMCALQNSYRNNNTHGEILATKHSGPTETLSQCLKVWEFGHRPTGLRRLRFKAKGTAYKRHNHALPLEESLSYFLLGVPAWVPLSPPTPPVTQSG